MSISILQYLAKIIRSSGWGHWLDRSVLAVDRLLLRFYRPPLHIHADGCHYYGFLRHTYYLSQLKKGTYELFSLKLFESNLSPGMTIVDGGSHIGLYSIRACRKLGDHCQIIAYEPDPYNYRALIFNIQRNNCRSIDARQTALSDRIGKAEFYMGRTTVSSSLMERKEMESIGHTMVSCTTLEEELKNQNAPSLFIKLDVEGAEGYAVLGMKNILKKPWPIKLLIECNPSALSNSSFSPNELIRLLLDLGFNIYSIDEEKEKLFRVTPEILKQKGNLYCTRE